jgi:hypothetical protein
VNVDVTDVVTDHVIDDVSLSNARSLPLVDIDIWFLLQKKKLKVSPLLDFHKKEKFRKKKSRKSAPYCIYCINLLYRETFQMAKKINYQKILRETHRETFTERLFRWLINK